MELRDKVVLVTGSAHGIGEATCRAFAEAGSVVVATSMDDDRGRKVAEEISSDYEHLDVSRLEEWEAVIARVVERHGKLDILICNSGVMTRPVGDPFGDDFANWLKPEFYHRIRGVNLDGVLYGIMTALPHFLRNGGGAVCIVGSLSGLQLETEDPFYAMIKNGVCGLARSLGPALKPSNITVNTLCPGGIETRLIPSDIRETRKTIPASRLSPPSYAAKAIVDVVAGGETGNVWVAFKEGTDPWIYEYPPQIREIARQRGLI